MAQACNIPLDTAAIEAAEFYRPPDDSPEMLYLAAHREKLGGYLPTRAVQCEVLSPPPLSTFAEFFKGSERPVSTTMAVVRMLSVLMKDPSIGRYIVPIVPDEARTFGLDGLFREAGIYSPEGQHYTPVDGGSLLPYREAEDGQILQEGICETGAMASFLAAGTAYAVHGVPTIPFYMFYSIFGFQRVGDMIWACGDMMCRGFLLGGTAGRTTLNGEGLQHQDGHSHVVANTVPNLKSYDPAFAYELAIIVREGIRRMYQEQEHIFYYLTIYNENYPMPALEAPEAVQVGVLSGLYCYRRSALEQADANVHLFGSGSILQQALHAQVCLAEYNIAADVWSATSYNELYRDAMACERWNRLHPTAEPRVPYLQRCLDGEDGVFVAVSDYMKALPNSIAPWMPGRYLVLGTDGYGLSEARPELRAYFEIDPAHITVAAMYALAQDGQIKFEQVEEAIARLGMDASKIDPAGQ